MSERLDLEKLLLKILQNNDDGVKYKDIIEYKKRILEISKNNNIKLLISGINKNELERTVIDYPELFRVFDNTYYKAVSYNSNYFDNRNSEYVNSIMEDALNEYKLKKANYN